MTIDASLFRASGAARRRSSPQPMVSATARRCLAVLSLACCAEATCDKTCVGLAFSGDHANSGQPVCGHEGCPPTAPYIGLETYGCSDQPDSWGGDCCNQDTCDDAGVAPPGGGAGGDCSDNVGPERCDAMLGTGLFSCATEFCAGGEWASPASLMLCGRPSVRGPRHVCSVGARR